MGCINMKFNRDLIGLKLIAIIVFVLYNVAEFGLTIIPATEIDSDYVAAVIGLILTDVYYLTLIWLVGSIRKLGERYYKLAELHRGESKLLKAAKEEK